MDFKVFESSEKNVWKYVFTKEDMVAEAVLYRYEDFYERTVICCSTMSGCPVGCKFCGTGNKFIRNLTYGEIVGQIATVLKDKNITDIDTKGKRFQIMFMSMGEPLLNWDEVEGAIEFLHKAYPNAELLLSTIAPNDMKVWNRVIDISKRIDKVGLQFSIHKSTDDTRDKLIPYENKLNLREIRDIGTVWWKATGRNPFLNYCIDGTNNTPYDYTNLAMLFSPIIFNFTFSVVCSKDENMKKAGYRNLGAVREFEQKFSELGYNTRVFDPDGQDDIGGGCGQLWYVQQWMKEREPYGAVEEVNVIESMIGKTFIKVFNMDDEELHFLTNEGEDYIFYHSQDCCECVEIEDISDSLELLENSPITMAEEFIHENLAINDSTTYTFYKFATAKGYVTVRWCGSSNGYYSESVDFRIKKLSAED